MWHQRTALFFGTMSAVVQETCRQPPSRDHQHTHTDEERAELAGTEVPIGSAAVAAAVALSPSSRVACVLA